MPISRRATSRSTRSRCRSRAASRTILTAVAPISRPASSGPCRTRPFGTIRFGCSGPCASRTSSASGWTSARRSSCGRRLRLAAQPAGERILGELCGCPRAGIGGWTSVGLLEPLGGSLEDLLDAVDDAELPARGRASASGCRSFRSPASCAGTPRRLLRARPPADGSARSIHRFRRRTEPWALHALAFLGADELAAAVEESRRADPPEPLVRGDELGLPPGPEIGRILALIEEERAAGTISTRDEALALAREARGRAGQVVTVQLAACAPGRAGSGALRARPPAARAVHGEPRSRSTRAPGRARSRLRSRPYVGEVVGIGHERRIPRGRRGLSLPRTCASSRVTRPRSPSATRPSISRACIRVLHHVRRPELAVSELARVTRPGGRVLIADQLGADRPPAEPRDGSLRAASRPEPPAVAARTRTSAGSSMRTISCCSRTR